MTPAFINEHVAFGFAQKGLNIEFYLEKIWNSNIL